VMSREMLKCFWFIMRVWFKFPHELGGYRTVCLICGVASFFFAIVDQFAEQMFA
jgi:hypothetical protein